MPASSLPICSGVPASRVWQHRKIRSVFLPSTSNDPDGMPPSGSLWVRVLSALKKFHEYDAIQVTLRPDVPSRHHQVVQTPATQHGGVARQGGAGGFLDLWRRSTASTHCLTSRRSMPNTGIAAWRSLASIHRNSRSSARRRRSVRANRPHHCTATQRLQLIGPAHGAVPSSSPAW
jgi:hypothetical protein